METQGRSHSQVLALAVRELRAHSRAERALREARQVSFSTTMQEHSEEYQELRLTERA